MQYVSTRGAAPVLSFEDAMISGLARDGGLYVPDQVPVLSVVELKALRGKPFADVAFAVASRFADGAIPEKELRRMVDEAYATFAHKAVTPLKQLDANHFLLELFHGPTIAFKDVAMQLLARLMDWSLERSKSRATIVGATSGDTGGAAIEAFRHSRNASIYILHPHGRVSDVQRRQMTTVHAPHVHNIALEGTFDDCQSIVKALFNDHAFRDEIRLAGVNSINWVRVMAQISYYIFAGLALGAPDRAISFAVPTGNFGNVFAGLMAKRMGLPIDRLVIATNANDILDRTVKSGRYEVKGVHATTSPSMDIQVSSNFERLVFLANNRDASAVTRAMDNLKQSNSFTLASDALQAIRDEFDSGATGEAETAATMRAILAETGEVLDPHTAVAVAVAQKNIGKSPMVTLATAHPAKFPDAVEKAIGLRPGLPQRFEHLMDAQESFTVLPNSVDAVKQHIKTRNPL
ncbi:threonine synthase [Aestuariivirga sp.]|uniref:threonine synthase n=1 Tax=Aestuariivirga sp. TaxID=2650926 RepID=UPI0039E6A7D0